MPLRLLADTSLPAVPYKSRQLHFFPPTSKQVECDIFASKYESVDLNFNTIRQGHFRGAKLNNDLDSLKGCRIHNVMCAGRVMRAPKFILEKTRSESLCNIFFFKLAKRQFPETLTLMGNGRLFYDCFPTLFRRMKRCEKRWISFNI